VPWSILGPQFIAAWGHPRGEWMPEHLEVLGQNGSGKSYFVVHVLAERAAARGSHIVIVATKPADRTLTQLGWPVIDSWPANYGQNQVVFWPKVKGLDRKAAAVQRDKIRNLLGQLWVPNSNRIVAFDEIHYLDVDLGLRHEITRYFREGRSMGITCVATTQRPAGVNRWIHSETAWKVFFAPQDQEDALRMAEVAGSRRLYTEVLLSLDRTKYEFLMVRGLTGETYISHVEKSRTLPAPRNAGNAPRGASTENQQPGSTMR
jgi:hypothetical protein